MLSWPFDSVATDDGEGNISYDRQFDSASLRKMFSLLYTNGVAMTDKSDALQVVPDTGMEVTVKTGMVIIEGAMGYQEEEETVEIDAAPSSNSRIDSIVARLDTNLAGRSITIEYIKGNVSAKPSAPSIVRTGGVFDLRIANILVASGTTAVTAYMITDTRLGDDCGVAVARPQVVDTDDIFTQYQASLTEFMQYVQDCIDETTAGDLQAQITAMQNPAASGSLANQLASLTSAVNTLNDTLEQSNRMIAELSAARNVRTLTPGFAFNNANWVVDSVYSVGKIVFLKGHLSAPWNTSDTAKWSSASSTPVLLTCPSGYRPVAIAEFIFGAKSANYKDDVMRFQLNSEVSATNQDGSTKHLVYGYAQSLRSTNNYYFQVIYVRNGSVTPS